MYILVYNCLILCLDTELTLSGMDYEEGDDDDEALTGIDVRGHSIRIPRELLRLLGQASVTVGSFFYSNMSGILPASLPGENE